MPVKFGSAAWQATQRAWTMACTAAKGTPLLPAGIGSTSAVASGAPPPSYTVAAATIAAKATPAAGSIQTRA